MEWGLIIDEIKKSNGLFAYEGDINTPQAFKKFESSIAAKIRNLKSLMSDRYKWDSQK